MIVFEGTSSDFVFALYVFHDSQIPLMSLDSEGYNYLVQLIRLEEGSMRTVQMTLDDDFVAAVDRVAKQTGTTRSAFTRKALRPAIQKAHVAEMERRHREGYKRKTVRPGEFGDWGSEQVWVEPEKG